MTASFDIADVSEYVQQLGTHPHARKIAFVLPLVPGKREFARMLLDEGPPFPLQAAGLDSHEVLLTDTEAIFVFGTPKGPETLERVLADEDFWTVAGAWERIAAGPPRHAEVAFDWHR